MFWLLIPSCWHRQHIRKRKTEGGIIPLLWNLDHIDGVGLEFHTWWVVGSETRTDKGWILCLIFPAEWIIRVVFIFVCFLLFLILVHCMNTYAPCYVVFGWFHCSWKYEVLVWMNSSLNKRLSLILKTAKLIRYWLSSKH